MSPGTIKYRGRGPNNITSLQKGVGSRLFFCIYIQSINIKSKHFGFLLFPLLLCVIDLSLLLLFAIKLV